MTKKLRPIDRENFDSQLQSFSIRAIVQNMNYLACKANEIIETVNDILEKAEGTAKTDTIERYGLHFCHHCGTVINAGQKYCHGCGWKFSWEGKW